MKHLATALAVLLAGSIINLSHAGPAPERIDRAAIRAQFDRFLAAWNQEDLEAATAIFTKDAVVYDPAPPGVFLGREAIHEWTRKSFQDLDRIRIEVSGVRVRIEGETAWITAHYSFSATRDGLSLAEEGNLSMIWIRMENGAYLSPLFHASRVPAGAGD